MGKRWQRERRRDPWYRRAKEEGYRSRAAYKLMQIDDKYHVLSKADVVVDLGASPGGWSQVAAERVGDDGRVLAVDLEAVRGLEEVEFLQGDLRDGETLNRIEAALREGDGDGQADVVVSDMSPDISGNYATDVARSVHLAEMALEVCHRVLRPGGSFVVKVFEGDLFPDYVAKVKRAFDRVKRTVPEASRNQSSEIYVVGKGFQG